MFTDGGYKMKRDKWGRVTGDTKYWEITWSNGRVDIIESEDRPDEECIESGIDADSSLWGHTIKKIRRIK